MSEKHPDRTKEWRKQQDALKNPKTIPTKTEDNNSKNKPSAQGDK